MRPLPVSFGAPRRLDFMGFGLALLLLAGCGRGRNDGAIVASGHVEATDVRIATKIPGRLLEFALQEGDRVTTGQLMARIDSVDLGLELQTTRAQLGQAEADLAMKERGSRPEDIQAARAQLAAAEASLAGAERDLARLEALVKTGAAALQQRDDARTRRDMARATRQAAAEQLRKLQNGFRPEEVAWSRSAVAVVRANVARFEQQLKDTNITSPLNGILTEKLAQPGELLQAGAPLCVITNLGDAWLTAYVPGPDLAKIRLGQEARVRTDDNQTRTGRIDFISPEAEFTPRNVQTRDERVKLVYRIKVGLPNSDGLFKPGMPAEATIIPVAS